ncbi:alpha/beta fold hydrolase [Streptomyces parvus]|uniref:alpha/beta fold hydrolase n=1 Tax=Streptomyces parvus TaxID=66428 RepID=UPI00332F4F84
MERTIQKRFPVGDGSWVTVDVYGEPDAPGLVVVPGAMSDALGWRAVATAVGAWPSVAVVNRRGREPSGPMTAAYSLRTEVADLGVVSTGSAAPGPSSAGATAASSPCWRRTNGRCAR